MDAEQVLIIVKGEDKTEQIKACKYSNGKYDITYSNARTYSYYSSDVIIYQNPQELDITNFAITIRNQSLSNVMKALRFKHHIRVFYKSGFNHLFSLNEVGFVQSCFNDEKSRNIFHYLKQLASVVSLKMENGSNILEKHYNSIESIREDSVLAALMNPSKLNNFYEAVITPPMFPFGFNNSQKLAVHNALCSKVSIIEGPPGTGKTQTILNLIANIVMEGKTVAVVSGNNSATSNVLEKLEKYNLGFIVASLGSTHNKEAFINNQMPLPIMNDWYINENQQNHLRHELFTIGNELNEMLNRKNRLSELKQQLMELEIEKRYFDDYYSETYQRNKGVKSLYSLKSNYYLKLWYEYQLAFEKSQRITLGKKISYFFQYGIYDKELYKQDKEHAIAIFQLSYYESKIQELKQEIESLEAILEDYRFDDNMSKYSELSMIMFKTKLYNKYQLKNTRKMYKQDDLWKSSQEFMLDYPVILSTTYSLRSSLSPTTTYDYLIIDESSQVDLVTGALALSCATRAIIVGDRMQLPNVVSQELAEKTNKIYKSYDLPEPYQYSTNSLLSAAVKLFESAPQTLLKEHYRCHPKIIGFCNQKFYNNQLIVLTDTKQEDQPLKAYKTVSGNHARGHKNQREVDVIFDELIPKEGLEVNSDSIGIITPYNKQIEAMEHKLKGTGIEAATVHKYQGREKDYIILTTVDNEITDFTDNPNLLNVAVSRAVKKLFIVTSGNRDERDTNIRDLINYIEYNNFEVVNSEVYSVFDYLYKEYSEQRFKMLQRSKKISDFASENLFFGVLEKVLQEDVFSKLAVAVHVPLKMVIRDFTKLDELEVRFASNLMTHVDFLVYDKLSHMPLMSIEVDGTSFHNPGSRQAERDEMKDNILKKYAIPHFRFRTDESNEEARIRQALMKIGAQSRYS